MRSLLYILAAIVGLQVSVSSLLGATVTLTPLFLGYSSADLAPFGNSPPTGLNTAPIFSGDYRDLYYATKDLSTRYYFAVNMTFSAGSDTTTPEDFRALLFNIVLPPDNGGNSGVPEFEATSRIAGGSPAFYENTAGGLNEAVGTSTTAGFINVFPNQPDGPTAFDSAFGQNGAYTLGYFVLKKTDPNEYGGNITLTETGTSFANNFTYFINNSDDSDSKNYVTTRDTFVGNPFTFPAIPEPAGLGVLAAGALALIRRHQV